VIKTANLVNSVSRKAGGLFESVRRLVQSLSEGGMEVRVFGGRDEFTAEDVRAWAPVEVKTFKPVWPERFGYSRELLEELEAFGPDLTHTHGIWLYPSVVARRYCGSRNRLYLISLHGMLDPWALRNSAWKKVIAYFLYEKAHLRGASCLRALCDAEARAIRQLGLKNPIAVIPNGIDVPILDDGRALKLDGPRRGPRANGRKVLLYLGRIHRKKGLVNLIKAWKQILDSQRSASDWLLAIAGWDENGHEAELKQLASELEIRWQDMREEGAEGAGERTDGRQDSVCEPEPRTELLFPGPQFGAAKAAWYRDCEGLILPSFSEGLPMVVLESWAYAKPVLMTPQCNLPEGFTRGAAMKIESKRESIAQGLVEFLEMSAEDRAAVGRAGRELAAERFTWRRIAEQMSELYEWMLGGGERPSCLADFQAVTMQSNHR
jgi:poly(glycerol-phosphate) alpha-glucosyltransferase